MFYLDAILKVKGERKPLIARFYGDENGKIEIKTKEQADKIYHEVCGKI